MAHNLFNSLQDFTIGARRVSTTAWPALEKAGVGKISRLPVSIRIVLESVLRNCDGIKVTEEHVRQLANWKPTGERVDEIPFVVARGRAAGLHRRSRCWRTWRRCATSPTRWARTRRRSNRLVPVDLVVGPFGDDRPLR